jgi:Uncharacterized membrane-associated protein
MFALLTLESVRAAAARRDGADRLLRARLAGLAVDRGGRPRRIAAAIIGDNLGYWVARKAAARCSSATGLTRSYAEKYLPRGERFFARHGGKTVFIGRFVAVLRVTTAWIAGISHMQWWRFLAWNAAGGIVWATTVSLVSYYLGDAAASAFSRYGLYAAGGVIVITASASWSCGGSRSASSATTKKIRVSPRSPPRYRSV